MSKEKQKTPEEAKHEERKCQLIIFVEALIFIALVIYSGFNLT